MSSFLIVPKPGEDVCLGAHFHVHCRPHGKAYVLQVHASHPTQDRVLRFMEQLSSQWSHLSRARSHMDGFIPPIFIHVGGAQELRALLEEVSSRFPFV